MRQKRQFTKIYCKKAVEIPGENRNKIFVFKHNTIN